MYVNAFWRSEGICNCSKRKFGRAFVIKKSLYIFLGNMTDYDRPNRCTLNAKSEHIRPGNLVSDISNGKHVFLRVIYFWGSAYHLGFFNKVHDWVCFCLSFFVPVLCIYEVKHICRNLHQPGHSKIRTLFYTNHYHLIDDVTYIHIFTTVKYFN